MGIEVGAGVVIGAGINQLYSLIRSKIADSYNVSATSVVELAGIVALNGVVAKALLDFFENRGEDLVKGPLGAAPFFFFLFVSQPDMMNLVLQLTDMAIRKIKSAMSPSQAQQHSVPADAKGRPSISKAAMAESSTPRDSPYHYPEEY